MKSIKRTFAATVVAGICMLAGCAAAGQPASRVHPIFASDAIAPAAPVCPASDTPNLPPSDTTNPPPGCPASNSAGAHGFGQHSAFGGRNPEYPRGSVHAQRSRHRRRPRQRRIRRQGPTARSHGHPSQCRRQRLQISGLPVRFGHPTHRQDHSRRRRFHHRRRFDGPGTCQPETGCSSLRNHRSDAPTGPSPCAMSSSIRRLPALT